MAFALSKALNYQHIAETYSNVSKAQLTFGKEFVALLDVKPGENVLDMGCGTGELTTHVAAQVGEEGQVVGVDPDTERIKVATQKNLDGRPLNVDFVTGDSSSNFPHFNEEYYDIHFSNFVFHRLTPEEKAVYFKTATKCLKPGGRIGIHSEEKLPLPEIFKAVEQLFPDGQIEKEASPSQQIKKAAVESMLREAGFAILSSEYEERSHVYSSIDKFITWKCASGYLDETKIVPEKRKAFAKKYAREDGTVYVAETLYHVIAKKSNQP